MRKTRRGSHVVRKLVLPMILILSVLIVWAGCDPTVPYQEPQPGMVCRWDFPSSADGFGIPCSVYLPSGYDSGHAYPVWLELHALYGKPLLDNDSSNPFSAELRRLADERGWIILAPWGRNLHSLYADGIARDQPPYLEPHVHDDFLGGAGSWQPLNGTWEAVADLYRQSDDSPSWKESVCLGSTGEDYAVRVKVRDLTAPGTTSAVGVNLRRSESGDCYHIDLYRSPNGSKYVRLMKRTGGAWQELYALPYDWQPLVPENGWICLKFSCYQDYLEVYVNEEIVNMQPGYDATPYGYGRDDPGEPHPPGEVSLCSYGGVHEFDDLWIQNEYEHGERDIMDCVLGAMEKYRIDPGRVYVAGHSQGGLGAFILGVHSPDLFAALRPAGGFSDIYYDYLWLKTYYPENPGPPYADVNDGRLTEYMRTLAGGEPGPDHPERLSVLNGSSARYILENATNNYWRIVHGTPDANVPNSYDPVQICWWAPWWFTWGQFAAPEPHNMATSTYANGKDIADLLQAWSSGGPYYCEYLTNPFLGHGFMDTYAETADFFQDKVLEHRPAEVAYKTYDDVNSGAWWLRLEIPHPGLNEPGMARVRVDMAGNSTAVHARNLSRLTLDLDWMGLDSGGAGNTITFSIDDDTSPNVFEIEDTTGVLALELVGSWTDPSGYELHLDGENLQLNEDYTIDGLSLVLNDLETRGGHDLVIQVPYTLPGNLVPNPGTEEEAQEGGTAGWTGETQGGTALFTWEDLEAHGGGRSLRIKGVSLYGGNSAVVWRSSALEVTGGEEYLLSAFAAARMFKGGDVGIGIAWCEDDGDPIGDVVWSDPLNEAGEICNRDWSPLSIGVTAPPGSACAYLVAGIRGTSPGDVSGSAWFDDFSFTGISP